MRIEIEDKWVITSDKFQFILQEKGIAKEGKNAGQEVLKSATFYPRIDLLISALISRNVRESDVSSLEQMAYVINKVAKSCQQAFEKIELAVEA